MIEIFQKTALMRGVRYDGTEDSAEEIIAFMRDERGFLYDEQGNEIGRREAGWFDRHGRMYVTGGLTEEQRALHNMLLRRDSDVLAVIWNDLHKYWNPLRVTDYVGRDSQGCFYPIAVTDVIGSYMKVGEK